MKKLLTLKVDLWFALVFFILAVVFAFMWRKAHNLTEVVRDSREQLVKDLEEVQRQIAIRESQIDSSIDAYSGIIDSLSTELTKTHLAYEEAAKNYSSVNYRFDRGADYYKVSWSDIIATRPDTNTQ
jgi:sensor domain CHASE-containing protein